MVSGSVAALPGAPAGTPSWPLSQADAFYVADVDGDGLDEIVVWNGARVDGRAALERRVARRGVHVAPGGG